jgi:Kef-type K+ transport system membrane component KefB
MAAPTALQLAALGLLAIAWYLVGRLGAVLRLPLITGYLVAGMATGPHVGIQIGRSVPILPRWHRVDGKECSYFAQVASC